MVYATLLQKPTLIYLFNVFTRAIFEEEFRIHVLHGSLCPRNKKVGGIDTQRSLLNCRIVLVNINQGTMLNNLCGIGHFRVTVSLIVKARLGAKVSHMKISFVSI